MTHSPKRFRRAEQLFTRLRIYSITLFSSLPYIHPFLKNFFWVRQCFRNLSDQTVLRFYAHDSRVRHLLQNSTCSYRRFTRITRSNSHLCCFSNLYFNVFRYNHRSALVFTLRTIVIITTVPRR